MSYDEHYDDKMGRLTTREAMRWYGWGSPVGLSLFVLLVCASVAIIKLAFFH